jgi:hypothetical protein
VALWVVLSALALLGPGNKADLFETKLHAMGLTRHVESDRCADNPAFCQAFSLGEELSLWTDPESPAPPAPPDQAR